MQTAYFQRPLFSLAIMFLASPSHRHQTDDINDFHCYATFSTYLSNITLAMKISAT